MGFFLKLSTWYFSRKALPYWGVMFLDCIIIVCSGLFVHVLNYGLLATAQIFFPLIGTLVAYLFFYIVGFRVMRTYSGILRYSSFVDLQRVGFAMIIGIMLVILSRLFFRLDLFFVPVRARDLVGTFLVATSCMWAMRVLVKFLYDTCYSISDARRVFIYGVKEGGISIAKSIRNQSPSKFNLIGFVTDDNSMIHHTLMGVRVHAIDERLIPLMRKRKVTGFMVSPLVADKFREDDKLINALIEAGIHIYMVNAATEWDGKDGTEEKVQLKEVNVEDLLPREKIEIDMKSVGDLLTGKRILITGAAGSIGSEMVRQIAIYNPQELILVDQAETPLHDIRLMMAKRWPGIKSYTIMASISNKTRMEAIFSEHKPDYVFHAAAYKHVPMMEDNPSESIQNNVEGTRIVADLAVKYGTKKFVMISTDKAVNPTNVMGCSKRICEIYVQSLDKAIKDGKIEGVTQFVTTRFGNVLGSNGSVIPLFKRQIEMGGPVTVTDPKIIRFFMLIPEACKLVLEAGTMGKGGEIFVFDMGKPVKIVDLAKRMILLSGAQNIEIKFTGLRDGEKLYEEVLNDKEITVPTDHKKIMVAKVREYDYENVVKNINGLFSDSFTYDDMKIVSDMKKIVPEFVSEHSKYQKLDCKKEI